MNAARRWRPGRVLGRLTLMATVLGFACSGTRADEPAVTDATVEAAIQKAVARIRAARKPTGHWEEQTPDHEYWTGTSGLAVLSLLYAGVNAREEELDQTLSWLAAQNLQRTYTYAVRAHVFALVPGRKYASRLQGDLDWLIKAAGARGTPAVGAYNYTPIESPNSRWDNSNTQFGVLGVWMAAEAGQTVPDTYWEAVAEHWLGCQNADGGWSYEKGGETRGTMTAAGVASLFVALDQRYAGQKEAGPIETAIERGLDWIGREYGPANIESASQWLYYYLYGLERVGRASGYKYFRDKDWFRSGAEYLLQRQDPKGGWGGSGDMDDIRNTAFGLMFLCHGRAPLVFNKLQHGPDWNRRLRDAAGVTRFASRAFERLLNWQIVRLDGTLEDLLEAPVLYVYGESKWTLDDVEVQKLQEYCKRGGLIFMVAGKEPFRQTFEELAQRAFPQYRLRTLPPTHLLFSGEVQFELKDPPVLQEINNGVRTLILFAGRNPTSDWDPAGSWNRGLVRGKAEADFHLAANVYLYATDKSYIRSRLQTPTIVKQKRDTPQTIKLARLSYAGKWDIEPYGWTRLEAYMNNETGVRLLVNAPVAIAGLDAKEYPVAHVTGTGAFKFTADERKALRQFLTGGGTLLADAAGGSPEFTSSLEAELREITLTEPRAVPPDAPLLTGAGLPEGIDLGGVEYRRAARSLARGQKYPRLMSFQVRRRHAVIYSPLDLSTGLLGTPVFNVEGYDPGGALQIMRNMLLYANLPPGEKEKLERAGS
ncbi:MAG: DUF4159 domain-containing protein [Planctomycetota bacterium]